MFWHFGRFTDQLDLNLSDPALTHSVSSRWLKDQGLKQNQGTKCCLISISILNITFLVLTITNAQTKMRKRHGHRGLLVAQKEEWRQFRSKVNVSFKFLIVQNWKQWIQVRFSKPFLGAATYAEAEVNPWVHTSAGKNCRGLLGSQGDWSSLKLLVSAASSIFFAVAFESFKKLFPIYLIFAQKAIFPTLCILVKDWF